MWRVLFVSLYLTFRVLTQYVYTHTTLVDSVQTNIFVRVMKAENSESLFVSILGRCEGGIREYIIYTGYYNTFICIAQKKKKKKISLTHIYLCKIT